MMRVFVFTVLFLAVDIAVTTWFADHISILPLVLELRVGAIQFYLLLLVFTTIALAAAWLFIGAMTDIAKQIWDRLTG